LKKKKKQTTRASKKRTSQPRRRGGRKEISRAQKESSATRYLALETRAKGRIRIKKKESKMLRGLLPSRLGKGELHYILSGTTAVIKKNKKGKKRSLNEKRLTGKAAFV